MTTNGKPIRRLSTGEYFRLAELIRGGVLDKAVTEGDKTQAELEAMATELVGTPVSLQSIEKTAKLIGKKVRVKIETKAEVEARAEQARQEAEALREQQRKPQTDRVRLLAGIFEQTLKNLGVEIPPELHRMARGEHPHADTTQTKLPLGESEAAAC